MKIVLERITSLGFYLYASLVDPGSGNLKVWNEFGITMQKSIQFSQKVTEICKSPEYQ